MNHSVGSCVGGLGGRVFQIVEARADISPATAEPGQLSARNVVIEPSIGYVFGNDHGSGPLYIECFWATKRAEPQGSNGVVR